MNGHCILQATIQSSWTGTAIVIAVLLLLVALAVRRLLKKGGGCAGSCAGCDGCADTEDMLRKLKKDHPEVYAAALRELAKRDGE